MHKAAAQHITNVARLEKNMLEVGITKKFADLNSIASIGAASLVGKTARAVVHDGSQYCIGDVVFSGGECGEIAACCDEHGSLYVVVEVLRRMRQVTPHNALFTPTKAMQIWRVESLDAAGAWRHDAGSTLVVW